MCLLSEPGGRRGIIRMLGAASVSFVKPVCAQRALAHVDTSPALAEIIRFAQRHGAVHAPSIDRRLCTLLSIDRSWRTDGGMKTAINRLSKLKLKTVKISYSPTYTNFILNHIATNPAHPLNISQRRRQQEHKREGLWWHATNATDISKSGCVRTWARRRLRQAFVEELKVLGYDETGKLVDETAMQKRRDVMNVLRLGRSVDLTGSLRMHGVGPLVPAEFETVKEEVRGILEALLMSSVDTALGFAGEGQKSSGLGQRRAHADTPVLPRKVRERRTSGAPAIPNVAKSKPDSAVVEAAKELLRAKPQGPPQLPLRTRHTPDGAKRQAATPPPPRMKPRAEIPKFALRARRPHTKITST